MLRVRHISCDTLLLLLLFHTCFIGENILCDRVELHLSLYVDLSRFVIIKVHFSADQGKTTFPKHVFSFRFVLYNQIFLIFLMKLSRVFSTFTLLVKYQNRLTTPFNNSHLCRPTLYIFVI